MPRTQVDLFCKGLLGQTAGLELLPDQPSDVDFPHAPQNNLMGQKIN